MSDIRYNSWLHRSGSGGVYQDSSGNVGIGTSTIRQELHIHTGDSGASNIVCTNATTGTAAADGFVIGITGAEDGQIWHQESANIKFGTADTERLRIDSSGRLLIGTTTEGEASLDDLTIATSGDTGMTIRSGTSHNGAIGFSDGTSGADEYRGLIDYDHNGNFLRFYTNSAERLRIHSDGRICGGTAINTSNDYEFSITGADGTGGVYAHGRNHYLSNRSNAYASLTLKKSNADSDAVDYLQIRDSGNNYLSGISGAGNWKPAAGKGIDFASAGGSAGGSVTAVLDDYEEGTFTCAVAGTNLSSSLGKYTKIGNIVHATWRWDSQTLPTFNGAFSLNLPFTTISGSNFGQFGTSTYYYPKSAWDPGSDWAGLSVFADPSSATIRLIIEYVDGDRQGSLQNPGSGATGTYFSASITYMVA